MDNQVQPVPERKDIGEMPMRKSALKNARLPSDPVRLFSRKNAEDIANDEEKVKNYVHQVRSTLGFENDHSVAYAAGNRYSGLAIELRRRLIEDFSCHSHAEQVLLDVIVNNYIRALHSSEAYNVILDKGAADKGDATLLSILSKDMDRANRTLLTAYQLLAQLKRPGAKVSISAVNAFIAKEQQFSVNNSNQSNAQNTPRH